jgi:hypothetical protein
MMQINARSSAIGVIPKPETRSTERHQAGREVFGAKTKRRQLQISRTDNCPVATALLA